MMTALLFYLIIPGLLGIPHLVICTPTQQSSNQGLCKCHLEHYSNLMPSRQTGTNITLWVSFTTERILQHQQDVYWTYHISPSASFPGSLDLVDKSQLLYNASLTIFLNVTTDGNTYFGRYKLLVCNKTLQTFNVQKQDPCAIQEQLIVGINTSAVIPTLNNENVSLLCIVHGYYGPWVKWDGPNCSRDQCWTISLSNYYIDSNCTFYSILTITDPTTDDTGLYSCSLSKSSSLTTNITIFKLPQIMPDINTYLRHNQADQLNVTFTIQGVPDYVHPITTITNSLDVKTPCNSAWCSIIIERVPYQNKTLIKFIVDGGRLHPDNYTFQVCVKLNNNVSSLYAERYNQNPNCTTKHVNIYKDEFVTIVTASSVGGTGIILILLATIILLAVSIRWYRRRPLYRRIQVRPLSEEDIDKDCGSCKKIFILNDDSTDGETRDLCDILNNLSGKADGKSRAYKCHCIQDMDRMIDNYSNWVVSQIKESTIVLLVCSDKMHECLMQVTGPNNLYVTTGVLCGITIFNAIKQTIGKFSLVSLNRTTNLHQVPTTLAERKHYVINTDELCARERLCAAEDELQAEMEKYIGSAAGKDLNSLLEYLHHM